MSICLLVIGDGRDEIHDRAWASASESLQFDHKVVVDDREHELGFGGAIQAGWAEVIEKGCDYVFHFEADFIFNSVPPVERMIGVLERQPHLVQVALKRQAWNDEEKAAGGIVELHPDEFTQCTEHGDIWTEHRRFFTTNPSVYPVGLCHQGWPQVPQSEGIFTHRLLEDPKVRFAFWGAKFDPPMVEHIGVDRAGVGY